jgi:peroxiredoxin
MHQQAQLRLKKDEVEKLGAEVYVVVSLDLHRTRRFKEENPLLSRFPGPFSKERSLVFATALSDPAGRAAALYGAARKCLRWGSWVENQPTWFVIDRQGTVSYTAEPTFSTPTSYQDDVDRVLDALRKAAGKEPDPR